MSVIASVSSSGKKPEANVAVVDLDGLFSQSDVVSLHCPLTPQTERLVNTARLARMKPTAFLSNSRGLLVDEAALAQALNTGGIAGAGLDVLAVEPALAQKPAAAGQELPDHSAHRLGHARGPRQADERGPSTTCAPSSRAIRRMSSVSSNSVKSVISKPVVSHQGSVTRDQ